MFKKNKLKFTLPKNWKEVTFEKGLAIWKEKLGKNDTIKIFSLLTGLSYDAIRQERDVSMIYGLHDTMFFLNDLPISNPPIMPTEMAGLKIPNTTNAKFDLGNATVGQIEDMKAYLQSRLTYKSSDLQMIECFPFICAIYLQGLKGKYDYTEATLIDLSQESFYDVCQMGAFFFTKLSDLTNGHWNELPPQNTPKKKWMLALLILVLILVFTLL